MDRRVRGSILPEVEIMRAATPEMNGHWEHDKGSKISSERWRRRSG
jgi:hypothetical protein